MFTDFDTDSDYDFDFDGDPAGDFDDDSDRDPDSDDDDFGRGFGKERHDKPPAPTMPMTRRDFDSLYTSALEGTKSFLSKRREQKNAGMPTMADLAVSGAEVVGGAMASAYFAQRLRQSGLALPVGLTLGSLTLLASWLSGNKHLMYGGIGLVAGAGAMWAAGHGSLAAEGTDAPQVTPVAPPFARPLPTPPIQNRQFAGAAFGPAPAGSAFGGQAPLTPAQYANIFRGGA